MRLTTDDGLLKLSTRAYTLTFAPDRPFVYLDDPAGHRLAELFPLSSVHPLNGRDDTVRIGTWEVSEAPEEIVFSLRAESSVWKSKAYRFRCRPHRFVYEVGVEGEGGLAEVNYLGGYHSGQIRWGSGFFWSGQSFRQGFNPEPNADEFNHFPPAGGSVIDLTGVPLPGRATWFFTPAPFCYGFQVAQGWMGIGVEAEPGANRFTEYRYHAQTSGFYLSLSFEGHTSVGGVHRLPTLGFDFAADERGVLAAHVCALQDAGHARPVTRPSTPAWWREPIFCGWGAQCHTAAVNGSAPADAARQSLYDEFLETLEANGVVPGTVTIDDKWQATYGENGVDPAKWPDLPGFVRARHASGQRVLLWLKAWDPEGIPAEECITNAAGVPLAVDPTHPAFERRLRGSVRRMLSPEGYGADGFKVDFSARIPSGPGIRCHGDAWGLELMRLYLAILHDEAKRAKPDALIITHTPHPYLADVVDMVRLNDINVGTDIRRAMSFRAAVASIACPDSLIDTDNWPITDKASWREYTRLQPQLGVPSLYYASHIDSTREPLDADDYRLIREMWETYRATIRFVFPAAEEAAIPVTMG